MPRSVEMTPYRGSWNRARRAGRFAAAVAVVVGAVGVNLAAFGPAWSTHPQYVVVHLSMAGALAAAGLAMRADPALRGIGGLLVAAGYLQALPGLSWHDTGVWPWLSWVLGPVAVVPIGVVLLAYPAGRLTRRSEKWWLLAATGWLLGGRLLLGFFPPTSDTTAFWPVVFDSVAVRSVIDVGYNVGGLGVVVFFAVLLAGRWRGAGSLDRFVDAPVGIASVAVGVTAATHLIAFLAGGETRGGWAALTGDAALLAVPLSFIAVAIARQLLYASVATALVDLPPAATPADVQQALAASLHDPGLEILYWAEDTQSFLDSRGAASDPQPTPQRLDLTSHASDGSPLAVIRVDAAAHRYPQLLASALRLGVLALENSRLQAVLLARLNDVQESRARIVEAGLAERRRIERDLHDGAQQRFLAVAASLGRLRRHTPDAAAGDILEEARTDLRAGLKELRDLAHGIHPALLTEGGLCPAITSVCDNLPLRVQLAVPDRRWPQNVEATAYFVVCEALTNAAKHARSSTVDISIGGDDRMLSIVISDDGQGGARPEDGSGLRGLQDRVAALGGHLDLTSTPGSGTRIGVVLPCG